jgi:AcrR family transcriptional regulator
MAQLNTRNRLLDAAEQLVAQQGYANTSLRQIAAKAEANLAAVKYHFGSKEKLVSEMLSRRIEPLNKKRLAGLEAELNAAEKENRRPNGEKLLEAFIEPTITFLQSREGGRHFLRMFSRIHADPDEVIRREFLKHMVPVFLRFLEGLKKALPEIGPEKLVARLIFCIGAMGHGASMLVDEDLCKHGPELGLPPVLASQAFLKELLGFINRGMEAK